MFWRGFGKTQGWLGCSERSRLTEPCLACSSACTMVPLPRACLSFLLGRKRQAGVGRTQSFKLIESSGLKFKTPNSMAHFSLWHISYLYSCDMALSPRILWKKKFNSYLPHWWESHPLLNDRKRLWLSEVCAGTCGTSRTGLRKAFQNQQFGDGSGGQLKLELSGWSKKGKMISLWALIYSVKVSQNPITVECNPGRPWTHSPQGWQIHGTHPITAICRHH